MRVSTACGLLAFLAIPPVAAGQNRIEFEFGVRAGVPFTVPLTSRLTGPASVFSRQAFTRPPVSVGPAFAVVVYDRLTVQFDFLYKTMRFNNCLQRNLLFLLLHS